MANNRRHCALRGPLCANAHGSIFIAASMYSASGRLRRASPTESHSTTQPMAKTRRVTQDVTDVGKHDVIAWMNSLIESACRIGYQVWICSQNAFKRLSEGETDVRIVASKGQRNIFTARIDVH
jgi:hypothetical protein